MSLRGGGDPLWVGDGPFSEFQDHFGLEKGHLVNFRAILEWRGAIL